MSQIDEDYALSQDQIDFYRKNGFIQLNDVIGRNVADNRVTAASPDNLDPEQIRLIPNRKRFREIIT